MFRLACSRALALIFLVTFALQAEEKPTAEEAFLKQMQGEWELDSISQRGDNFRSVGSGDFPNRKIIDGFKMIGTSDKYPKRTSTLLFEIEEETKTGFKLFILYPKPKSKAFFRRAALAKIEDNKLLISQSGNIKDEPLTFEPNKLGDIFVWVRKDTTSKKPSSE